MRLQPGFWRKCRIGFRWCRITFLVLTLIVICFCIRFNRIGLPDFLKRPLIEKLNEHGIKAEFSRLRFSLTRGLIADNVRLGESKIPDGPSLSLQELQLSLDFPALLHRRVDVEGLVLRQGKMLWPLSPTNALALDNIQTDLRFQTNDTWSLDNFKADLHGAKITLSGDIAHASEMRDWEMFRGRKAGGRTTVQAKLQEIFDALEKIHFNGSPQLNLSLNGDARNLHSFAVHFRATAPSVETAFASMQKLQLIADLTMPENAPTNFDAAWSFWTNAQPYRLVWSARLASLRSKKLNAESIFCNGFWRAPELVIINFSAGLGGGQLDTEARLDVATRKLAFRDFSSFDLHALAPLLPEKIRGRLAEISWTQPPSLQMNGSLFLPDWTNRQPDWDGEVRRSLNLSGNLTLAASRVREVAIDSLKTHFSYSNFVWQLSDFTLNQAKTKLQLDGSENDLTKIYSGRLRGMFDVAAIRPYLTTSNAVRGMNRFTFTQPLALDLNLSGCLNDDDRISANGRVALTNFTIRAQGIDSVAGELIYTNRILEISHPFLAREKGAQTLTADTITLNFKDQMIYITNGFGTADPMPLTRAIGPKTAHLIEPYHFLQPPTAAVNGHVSMRDVKSVHDVDDADLRFDILQPAPFEWLKLKTRGIKGTIHWLGETLALTNVTAAFCGGEGDGFANFDFRVPHSGADYQFMVNVTNVNLHLLAADLSVTTNANHLEGALAGKVFITHADTRDLETWQGFGHARLRDGLLWDIPIFGILSPVLNTLSPGLGNSRATDAAANFSITNGAIVTDSLEIRSAMARLNYVGTVDLNQKVNARVTAQLLRDTWAVGPLISTVLWPVSKLFEYKVTGTLKEPQTTPVYVPKILLMPLHPIRSLEKMFPGDALTNAPGK